MPAEEVIARSEKVLVTAAGDHLTEAMVLRFVALAEAFRGNFAEARELVSRRQSIFEEVGLPLQVALNEHLSAQVEMLAGETEAAERSWRKSSELLIEMGERSYLSTRAAELAEKALYAQGKYDEAERFAELGREAGASDDIETQVRWRGALAKVLARRGDAERAERLAREAVDLAENTDFLELLGDVLADMAEVLRLAGRPDEARPVLEEALAVYERKGIVPSVERTKQALAELGITT
jgi:tetratricopeptide (TPR) repeat protein